MASKAISNTGPILHLSEIESLTVLKVFSNLAMPKEVFDELTRLKVKLPKWIDIRYLKSSSKDLVSLIVNKYSLDLAESCSIALAIQEKVDYFLTDDLDARIVGKEYGLEVHGSLGIILRAFRDKMIDRAIAFQKISELKTKSSLFITQELIDLAIKAINEYK